MSNETEATAEQEPKPSAPDHVLSRVDLWLASSVILFSLLDTRHRFLKILNALPRITILDVSATPVPGGLAMTVHLGQGHAAIHTWTRGLPGAPGSTSLGWAELVTSGDPRACGIFTKLIGVEFGIAPDTARFDMTTPTGPREPGNG